MPSTVRIRRHRWAVIIQLLVRPANVLTLSCKKPPHVPKPQSGTVAAATNDEVGRSECSRRDAVQFEPPEAARPPGQRTGGLAACEGS